MFLVPLNRRTTSSPSSSSPTYSYSRSPSNHSPSSSLTSSSSSSASFRQTTPTTTLSGPQQKVLCGSLLAARQVTRIFLDYLAKARGWLSLSMSALFSLWEALVVHCSGSLVQSSSPISTSLVLSIAADDRYQSHRHWQTSRACLHNITSDYYYGTRYVAPDMDSSSLCRRRQIAQRAGSSREQKQQQQQQQLHHCHWDYGAPSAGIRAPHLEHCTSVVDGLMAAAAAQQGRQLQTTPGGQGHQQQQQPRRRSGGLQIETGRVGEYKQQELRQAPRGQQHDTRQANASRGILHFKWPTSAHHMDPAHYSESSCVSKEANENQHGAMAHLDANFSNRDGQQQQQSMVMVSKTALSELTDQIAASMDKMKDLEEQVRLIPELQRRLEHVMVASGDSASSSVDRRDFYRPQEKAQELVRGSSGRSSLQHHSAFRFAATSTPRANHHPTHHHHHHLHHGHQFHNQLNASDTNLDHLNNHFGENSSSLASSHQQLARPLARQLFGANNGSSNQQQQQQQRQEQTTNGSRVEYEDLINDLISLSYSVDYLSPAASANNHGEGDKLEEQHERRRGEMASGGQQQRPALQVKVQEEANKQMDLCRAHFASSVGAADSCRQQHLANNGGSSGNSNRSSTASEGAGAGNRRVQELTSKLEGDDDDEHHFNQSAAPGKLIKLHASKLDQHPQRQHQLEHNSSPTHNCPNAKQPAQQPHQTTSSQSNSNILTTFSASSNNFQLAEHLQHSTPLHSHRDMILDNQAAYHHQHAGRTATSGRHHYGSSGTLSLQTTPIKSNYSSAASTYRLDCGCKSFKEHLRYNTISREQRLAKQQQQQQQHSQSTATTTRCSRSNSTSATVSPQPVIKVDASTNTDLSMDSIVTRSELNNLLASLHKTYSDFSTPEPDLEPESAAALEEHPKEQQFANEQKLVLGSTGASNSYETSSGSKSSQSPPSTSSPDDDSEEEQHAAIISKESQRLVSSNDDDDDDEDDDEDRRCGNRNGGSGGSQGEEPYSLGSSYQDPSDFEEYCAYGESLDRRTKDFIAPTTKITNDLRFALIRLNDFITKRKTLEELESSDTSSSCIELIRKKWFEVSSQKDSQASKTKLYCDYFESLTKHLLNTVINMRDQAGNTAMHYAASHCKLDIIKVLLDTKVCDVNCRNKAGYTPIMLLALAQLEEREEQEVARQLFTMGDVNIKARSSGQTAIMLAASHGRVTTCKLLLECGADPSLQDYDGSTALMCGSEIGNEEVVRCLLAHKLTDPHATDNDGLDALTIAMNNGHKSIGLMLYSAKNVPKFVRSTISLNNNPYGSTTGGINNNGGNNMNNNQTTSNNISNQSPSYLGASLRRSRAKLTTNYVRRADSLLISRSGRANKNS